MNLKELFISCYRKLKVYLCIIMEIFYYSRLILKHNASIGTDSNINKMQYTLLRENHVLEKGMSIRDSRKNFGEIKALNLIMRLNKYVDLYLEEDKKFLNYPLSTLLSYIKYIKKEGGDISKVESGYNELVGKIELNDISIKSGIEFVYKKELLNECNKDFCSLLLSRHSIRYFSKEIPSIDLINKALYLASYTPSACNRQGWFTYVFSGELNQKLLKWQTGARGFEDEIHCSILVTADLNAFLYNEIHQVYVDGGLYAMNLINSLHSLGLGTIPLSCGLGCSKLREMNTIFEIPENRVPILIVGVGVVLDKFKVAISKRKDISVTNKYYSVS